MKNIVRFKCLLCGRNKFTRKTAHYCVGGYRKRHIKWEIIEQFKINEMKASELRTGNLIYFLDDRKLSIKKICTIGQIPDAETMKVKADRYFIGFLDSGFWMDFKDGKFKPIPLTNEWIKNFGFTESEAIGVFFSGKIDLERISSDQGYGVSIHEEPIGLEINYVHQLQNLYYSLTGEELTLNNEDNGK